MYIDFELKYNININNYKKKDYTFEMPWILKERGIHIFNHDNFCLDLTQEILLKHLLKTMCTDIVNIVVNAVAVDHMMAVTDEEQLTSDVRIRKIDKPTI